MTAASDRFKYDYSDEELAQFVPDIGDWPRAWAPCRSSSTTTWKTRGNATAVPSCVCWGTARCNRRQPHEPKHAPLPDLFGGAAPPGIPGLHYEGAFLTLYEEQALVEHMGVIDMQPALYKGYTARRKVMRFGGRFDFDDHVLRASTPLPPELHPLRRKVSDWLGIDEATLVHALVAEYAPGTPLGWHRDVPHFETVAGVSPAGPAELRFSPFPLTPEGNRRALRVRAAPRSAYAMQGESTLR